MIVNFPLDDDPSVSMIAWTTTPWTLPSNLALCVHPEFTYVKVKGEGSEFITIFLDVRVVCLSDNTTEKIYIMLEDRLEALFKKPEEYSTLEKMKGSSLVGRKYHPLFPYFQHLKSDQSDQGAFRIVRSVLGYVGKFCGKNIYYL